MGFLVRIFISGMWKMQRAIKNFSVEPTLWNLPGEKSTRLRHLNGRENKDEMDINRPFVSAFF